MTLKPIYRFGYRGRAPEELRTWLEGRDAICLDVRYEANTRVLRWRRDALQPVLGARYRHTPELGLMVGGYSAMPSGELAPMLRNELRGLEAVRRACADFPAVCLLCTCSLEESQAGGCHVYYIAKQLRREILEVDPFAGAQL